MGSEKVPQHDDRLIMKNKTENVLHGQGRLDKDMLADTTSSINLTDARERSDVPLVLRRFILMTVIATVFFINADNGAFGPALL